MKPISTGRRSHAVRCGCQHGLGADVGTADIDWSHIKDLATDTAIITQGTAGELYIAKLAVTEANMVSLTVGELVVKGSDVGIFIP